MRIESDYLEILADNAWVHPQYYFGFSPEGDYLIVSKHRESSLLEQSNYRVAERILLDSVRKEPIECTNEERDERGYILRPDWVYDWRAKHSMVGWVDYLMVRNDAPESILIAAAGIVASLADYPVLSEDDYSEIQLAFVEDHWNSLSIQDRIDICHNSGESIYSARREYPYGKNLDYLLESEMCY